MKVAFCFSGELRSVDKTYSTLKSRIMQRFGDYDIFLHTWTDDPDLHKINIIKKDSNTKNVLVEPRVTF